ncbi:hypothetical protein ACGFZP_08010 [Kitasatospora sp. NPDC048239]|uniref:hypothetical protein n=1 Tax=Kitasatospora sp. NPDC048239 TaxID=3364046 RepID=UPI0037218E37
MLLFSSVLGNLLALPIVLPDLLAEQTPPQHAGPPQMAVLIGMAYGVALLLDWLAGRPRREARWVVPVRAVVLTGLSSLVAWLARDFLVPKVFGTYPGWTPAATLECVVVGILGLIWYAGVRRRARRSAPGPVASGRAAIGRAGVVGAGRAAVKGPAVKGPAAAGPTVKARSAAPGPVAGGRVRPAPGQVWVAMVPYRDRAESGRHHCVVLRARSGHAEVLQITRRNKDDRADHIRMSGEGWDRTGRQSWVEVGLPPRIVPYESFLDGRPLGPCPPTTWRRIEQRQAALAAERARQVRPKPDPKPKPAPRPRVEREVPRPRPEREAPGAGAFQRPRNPRIPYEEPPGR